MNVKVKKKKGRKKGNVSSVHNFNLFPFLKKKKINIVCSMHCISCDEYSGRSFIMLIREIINSQKICVQSINIKK